MKRIVLLIMVALNGVLLSAQIRTISPVEFEINLGAGIATDKLDYVWHSMMQAYGVEVRYNFPDARFDFGGGIRGGAMTRSSEDLFYKTFIPVQFYGVVDYNYAVSDRLTLFAGLAAGVAYQYVQPSAICDMAWAANTYNGKKWSPYISPRVGMECWDRLRVTMAYHWMDQGSRYTGIHLGYVFGGRKR